MSATVVLAIPTSSCRAEAAAAMRERVACWASARAFSSYRRFWVDMVFSEVYSAGRSLNTTFTERPIPMQTAPTILGPHDGAAGSLGAIGVRFMLEGTGFSLVEHPMPPRTLAAPLHRHS